MPDLTIGEVARRAGLRASAIRYYERHGLLAPPPRRAGARRYDPSVVDRLVAIAAGRRAGLGVAEIRTLLAAAEARGGLAPALAKLTGRIDDRIRTLTRLGKRLRAFAACGCAEPLRCELITSIERPDA